MSEPLIARAYETARETALEAGEVLLRYHVNRDFQVSKKGPINLVTEADVAAEQAVIKRIRETFPSHQILAEEQGELEGDPDFRWLIDPLDGTTNFAHSYPMFCVSIGLEVEGEVELGVIYNPVARELFSARRGHGAFLNGSRIFVSQKAALPDSLLVTGFSYDMGEIQKNLRLFEKMMMRSRAVRRDGSAAMDMCAVACGRFDGFWEISLHPWDVAAGKVIVEEAGGCVTAFDGSPCTIYDSELLATNGRVHREMSQVLTSVPL
jgi:myo-inositol-1(or 4)-monophosphatase